MPATPFVRKGCNLTLYDNDKIKLCTAEGKEILTGKEIEGLYYFECKTIHPSTTSPGKGGAFEFDECPPAGSAPAANSYFGLQVGTKINEAANDFAQTGLLLERSKTLVCLCGRVVPNNVGVHESVRNH